MRYRLRKFTDVKDRKGKEVFISKREIIDMYNEASKSDSVQGFICGIERLKNQ